MFAKNMCVFQANVHERVILVPKTLALIQGTIATGSTVQCCLTQNTAVPPGPETQHCTEVLVYIGTKLVKINICEEL